jgi:hypothetical protein
MSVFGDAEREEKESKSMRNELYIPQLQVRSSLKSGTTGGGYVNGVWYADKSGVCGGSTPPSPVPPPAPPPSDGGGYVGGVWFPDRSGVCG